MRRQTSRALSSSTSSCSGSDLRSVHCTSPPCGTAPAASTSAMVELPLPPPPAGKHAVSTHFGCGR